VKHNGFRRLALKDGAWVKLWSRRGTDYTDRLTRIRALAPVHDGVSTALAAKHNVLARRSKRMSRVYTSSPVPALGRLGNPIVSKTSS
jgi:hypothetical protein